MKKLQRTYIVVHSGRKYIKKATEKNIFIVSV